MKTRNLLLAMALPTVFAACTAEDLVNQTETNVLESRALLGDLKVNIENNVASRAAWSDETLTWGEWEDDDALTSAVVDATRGTVGDNLLTNYIWSKDANGTWGTTSQMVEGIYSFYSYKGIATKNDREPVKFDLTAQTADLDNPTKVIDDNQLFFSPLYNIEAKNTTAENTIDLPLQFYPYHSIAAFKMTNATGQTLLISQIIANGEFAAKGAILPTKIKAAGLNWYVRNGEAAYKLDAKEWNSDGTVKTEYTAKEELAMWQESDLDNIGGEGELSTSTTLAMNCGNWEWTDGEEIMAYMVIPAGSKVQNIEINVVDEEGEAKYIQVEETEKTIQTDVKSIASTGITKQTFKRSVPVSIFGYTSAGIPKGITAKAGNLADAKGYYIDSKEALIDLVNISRGDIRVYNFGDWAVDAEIADIITEYTGGQVIFTNPMEVKDTEEVVINNITFSAGVTVKGADTTAGFAGTTAVFESANATTLTVEAGAVVTIKAGSYNSVENNGTLTVEAGVENAKIASNSTLNVYSDNNNITLNKGTLNYMANDADEDGEIEESEKYTATLPTLAKTDSYTINYANGVNLNVNSAAELAPATDKSATLNVNGGFTLDAKLVVAKGATMTVAGNIEGDGSLEINGTVTNNGVANVTVAKIAEKAKLYNNGEIEVAENNGMIVTGANSVTDVTSGNGEVDNTNEAQVTAGSTLTVSYTVENKAVEDLETILFKRYAVNTLRVKGTLTMDRPFGKDANFAQLEVLKTLVLSDNAEVKVDGDVHTSFTKVVVEGNAKIYGWSKNESSLTFDQNVNVVLTKRSVASSDLATSEGYVLTVKNVTVDGTCAVGTANGHVGGEGSIKFEASRCEEHPAATGYAYKKPGVKIESAVVKDCNYGSDIDMSGFVVEVTYNAETSDIDNGNKLVDALSSAKDGETVVLTAGTYNVDEAVESTGVLNISKNIHIKGEQGTIIVNNYLQRSNRVLQLYLNNVKNITLENLELKGTSYDYSNNLWIRTVNGSDSENISSVNLINVKCDEAIVDNGYVNGKTIKVEAKDCVIGKFTVDAWKTKSLETFSYLDYNSGCQINVNIQDRVEKSNIYINGVNPTKAGIQ